MARIAVISDIHGNLPALEATLEAIDRAGIREIICLGDVVGYGPDAAACLMLVHERCTVLVRGNHEDAILRPSLATRFNPIARCALEWTRRRLEWEHLTILRSMREVYEAGRSMTIVHDSPVPMAGGGYLYDAAAAAIAFRGLEARFCLVGHTHVPVAFVSPAEDPMAVGTVSLAEVECLELPKDARAILNPGSVGQPRDGDPRASFGVLDPERGRFELRRVRYDIARAQDAVRRAGLPMPLAERLALGA